MNETPIERALRWARERGMNQSAFASVLGVSPQDVTNWKRRGLPPDKYVGVAEVLGVSVDALLGKLAPAAQAGDHPAWPFGVPMARFEALSPDLRADIGTVVETLIGMCERLLPNSGGSATRRKRIAAERQDITRAADSIRNKKKTG